MKNLTCPLPLVVIFSNKKFSLKELRKKIGGMQFTRLVQMTRENEDIEVISIDQRYFPPQDNLIEFFEQLVLSRENLLLIQSPQQECGKFIKLFQKGQEEPIVYFVLTDEEKIKQIRSKELLPQIPVNQAELEKQAAGLAKVQSKIAFGKNYSKTFLSQVQYIGEEYQSIYLKLNDFSQYIENLHLSAEWLLDNSYTVRQTIRDVHKNLPEKFFRELPYIANGPYQGIPHIYPLVCRLVAATDGRISAENTIAFLKAYQAVTLLSMGELWAFPLVLKIRLIECLLKLTQSTLNRIREHQLAGFWGNRILNSSRKEPEKLYLTLAALSHEITKPTPYFAEQLMLQVGDIDISAGTVKAWLQRKLGEELTEIFKYEQSTQLLDQTSLVNTLGSLQRLTQLNWKEVFEKVNPVDEILSQDPASTYVYMDFDTRDRYRHAIEKMARAYKKNEIDVAQQAIHLSKPHSALPEQHVGYYLIDAGNTVLKKNLGESDFSWINLAKNNSCLAYCSACLLVTILFLFIAAYFTQLSFWMRSLLIVFSILPFSEAAIQIINFAMAQFLPPNILPKMKYEQDIPDTQRTLVIVPTLLSSVESINKDLEQLEIHYLGNSDPNILFGLLSDFKDADQFSLPEDQALLQMVEEGIKNLNAKYTHNPFYLFHRQRQYNEQQNCWMGWERKRGKLEHLNRFLCGDDAKELDDTLIVGDAAALAELHFIVTADSDGKLPKDSVKRLIETISHPLNIPQLDETKRALTRGYTIIQPRVSTNFLSANNSWFSRLFSDPSGVDPYSKSISDIYQDIFKEGVYHGKGIYDVKIFHHLLTGRLPQNQILSHDLLEGSYVRTAFASDIEWHDAFPETYTQFCKRQQRWVRGDWQILPWLGKTVYNDKNEPQKNPLSAINRWKIFTNLQRSLWPFSALLLLLAAWFMHASALWTWSILAVVAVPIVLQTAHWIWDGLKSGFGNIWSEFSKGALRTLVNLAFLPHQAWINTKAILVALYRQIFSRKFLLEWEISGTSNGKDALIYQTQLIVISLFSLSLSIYLGIKHPSTFFIASIFLISWIAAPFINLLLKKPYLKPHTALLTNQEQTYLRHLARRTWRYFDDLVTPEVHYLPPDNMQEKVRHDIAYRTSPTNIGFYLMSILSAHKMGYITLVQMLSRMENLVTTLNQMEGYEGHLFNWYDIKNLQPLLPRYISTVDSGNLMAALWTAEERCRTLLNQQLLQPSKLLSGITDTFDLLLEHLPNTGSTLKKIHSKLQKEAKNPLQLKKQIDQLHEALKNINNLEGEGAYWLKKFDEQLNAFKLWMHNTQPWLYWFDQPLAHKIASLHPEGVKWKSLATAEFFRMHDILNRNIPGLMPFIGWLQTLSQQFLDEEMSIWKQQFMEDVNRSFNFVDGLNQQGIKLSRALTDFSNRMNMGFLYNPTRKLFMIGYNVTDSRADTSYYDLLASEARLASFVSIARDDIPVDHWWALGRPFGTAFGKPVLLSWGGTMFEYLMPTIWCKNFENTLLDYSCKQAVDTQIKYAHQRGIPWGISESAYSRLDLHSIYQYRAFGVPSLGLKHGLEADCVVTPYSAALALMIDPLASIKNLKHLDVNEGMHGAYGLFEAIDFSREPKPGGKRGVIIHAYMAHHMGMTLSSLCNALCDNYLQNLFHSVPRVKAAETLLYERAFISDSKALGRIKERNFSKFSPLIPVDVSHLDTPLTQSPITHLLSNGKYSVMITNSGGGYSRCQELDITRWRADATLDNYGSFFYIRDLDRNITLSPAYQPLRSLSSNYHVHFSNHKAVIEKREHGLEFLTEIVVSPEDNVEIRNLTLANLSIRQREVDITSYLEIALAPHRADLAHPAFSKMFIETEAFPDLCGLLAYRRTRNPEEAEHYCFHLAITPEEVSKTFAFETSREKFIGRGNTITNPRSLIEDLSLTQGFVLDPIFSIRKKLQLPPGKRIKIGYITGYADSREAALRLMHKYKSIDSSSRATDMAWTHAELDLRRLHISHEDAKIYQRLANTMIYPDSQLRTSSDRLRRNRLSQNKLWAYGISGDNPILLLTIEDVFDLDIVHNVLQAHTFWSLRGLKTDVVILNEEMPSYERTLNEHLERIIQNYGQYTGINKSGGIFLISVDKSNREDQNLLFTVAHAVIIAGRGSLSQQLTNPRISHPQQPLLKILDRPEQPSTPLPFSVLDAFNGWGGFSLDGKEYTVYLANPAMQTAAPWINVIANKHFGCIASERGVGMSWSTNSQYNRLSPWSNDPVVDPSFDVCYIRDDENGKFWTITPGPIRENDPYCTRHGQGYTTYTHNSHTIEQEMTLFTPLDEAHSAVRIQLIRLTNRSSRTKKLSLFSYVELTMGTDREDTQRYIVSNWNYETKTLFASNHYRNIFSEKVVYCSSSPSASSFTCSRKEFIGRNGTLNSPEALKHTQLSQALDPAQDPCFALQTNVEIFPGDTAEIIFILGEAPHMIKAKELAQLYQNHAVVHAALNQTKIWWDRFLSKIQISTPEKKLDILFNRWLIYQTLSCRMWARSAFYQSGGAIGFRDQLQDALSLVYFDPSLTREHLIKCASRQFIEGDVQHWWHPEEGNGVRTRISDDLLWMPYVAMQYIKVTNDQTIMEEKISYIEGRQLEENEHEAFVFPQLSSHEGTLKEHCLKAIDRALRLGPHGLPLIGGGDWNDGMNLVGVHGQGESVWLAWFLIDILNQFGDWLAQNQEADKATDLKKAAAQLIQAIETHCWDGEWYLRAFFDNGHPVGSHANVEDKIDSLPQTWSIIAGQKTARSQQALESVEKHLIDHEHKLVKLFTPPYDKSLPHPGYIRGYPPGVRENGGQYTHASVWVAWAYAKQGNAEKAMQILRMINPIERSSNAADCTQYRVEPYAVCADIYALEGDVGRGGWTWYTGSASLMYRVILEQIIGFQLQGEKLFINPLIPAAWDKFELKYQHGEASYAIQVINPQHVTQGVTKVIVNGQEMNEKYIPLVREASHHEVQIILGGI